MGHDAIRNDARRHVDASAAALRMAIAQPERFDAYAFRCEADDARGIDIVRRRLLDNRRVAVLALQRERLVERQHRVDRIGSRLQEDRIDGLIGIRLRDAVRRRQVGVLERAVARRVVSVLRDIDRLRRGGTAGEDGQEKRTNCTDGGVSVILSSFIQQVLSEVY